MNGVADALLLFESGTEMMALKFPKPMQTNEILERCVASIFGSLPTRFIGGLRGEKIAVTTIGESQCLPTSPEYQSRITRKTEKDSIWKITDDSDEILNSLFIISEFRRSKSI